jgi:hypothetical protein
VGKEAGYVKSPRSFKNCIANNLVQQRTMECAFPCAKIEEDEEDDREELR